MSLEFGAMIGLILFFLIAGLPIGLSFISAGMLYLLFTGQDTGLAAEQILNGMYNNFVVLAVPMFIFASRVASAGSLMDRLVDVSTSLVGWLRGGMAHVNVFASLILSGMSGSAVADAAGSGRLQIEMMTKRRHYSEAYAAAITASSAVIGPIIPPSIPMVLYALVSNTSVGALFLGGVIPGVLMTLGLMGAVTYTANRKNLPVDERRTLPQIWQSFLRGFLSLLTPGILLYGLYSGAFTPTEAAGIAAAYALLLTWVVYREIGARHIYRIFLESLRDSTITMSLLAGSFVLNYVITLERIPSLLLKVFENFDLSATALLLLINLIFLILGMFLDASVLLLVAVPLVFPLVQAAGINPIHFGVVIVLNIMIGLITPPVGVLLFIVKGFVKASLAEIVRENAPFLVVLILVLLLIVLIPDLVLWLPQQVMNR
jgi:tripartite ATP-independent transporter DctM subunit